MQGYDQIQGFEYWNTEAWKNFVKDYVLPLHNSTSKLLRLRDFILTIVGTSEKVTLSEVERKQSNILPFLLGGIKEDGEYKDNSLAKLVRLTLGIYFDDISPALFLGLPFFQLKISSDTLEIVGEQS